MDKAKVLKGNFSTKRKLHFTDAKIKKISTRSQKLDSWKEETIWSDKYDGFGIRIVPLGYNRHLLPPNDFRLRYIVTGTPKGKAGNVLITGADPTTITVKEAVSWYKDKSALLQQGINPNEVNREARLIDEPTILELAQDLVDPELKMKPYTSATLATYRAYISSIRDRGCANKSFSDLTDADITKLLKGRGDDYKLNFISFLQYVEKRLDPKFKVDESIKDRIKRRYGGLPERGNRKHQYLAYEPLQQQIAQLFLAIQYATQGYQIRKGSVERWQRVDQAWSGDLSPQQLDNADATNDFYTEAQQDYFIKPTVTNRAITDGLMLIFLTGLRRKNICEIRWAHINWDTNTLLIPDMKMKEKDETVKIPLTNYTKAIFEYRNKIKKDGDEYVFPNENTRKPFSKETFTEVVRRVAIWACMLDYTDEYSNIRSLTKDRDIDMTDTSTYKRNPLQSLLATLTVTEETLDVILPELMAELFRKAKEPMKHAPDLTLNVRYLVKDLGFNPHGLRRTASNMARYLSLSPNIFLRHSGQTTDEQHYSSLSMDQERRALETCHKYLDNRIFESLGNDTEYNEKEFISPILKYYEKRAVIPQDEYFDMSKHQENQIGNEETTITKQFQLNDYPTELYPTAEKLAEVEQEINSKKLQVSESILGSNRMWDVDDNEIKGD